MTIPRGKALLKAARPVILSCKGVVILDGGNCSAGKRLDMKGSQSFSNGILGEFCYTENPQFLHDLPSMGFNGLHTYSQAGGDLFCAVAFSDKLKHLPFPGSQDRVCRGSVCREFGQIILYNDARDPRTLEMSSPPPLEVSARQVLSIASISPWARLACRCN